jgi:uncharacterized membrane protein YedE/YeeE
MQTLMEIGTAMPVGMAFGYVIQSSGVSAPEVIRGQMIFEKEIMMKMFLSGLAGSAFSLAFLSWLDSHAFEKARESRGWGDKGIVSAVIGGSLQGIGMAISGACPGMAYAQLGTGTESARYLYIGGILGSLAYSFLHPWLKAHHVFDFAATTEKHFESMHLERIFFAGNFKQTAMIFGTLALAIAVGLDYIVPWRQDVLDVKSVVQSHAVSPVAAGFSVGLLQIPLFYFLGSLLGCSSGYSVISSQIFRLFPQELLVQHTYAQTFMSGKAAWQVGLGLGIVVGAAFSSGYGQSVIAALQHGESFPTVRLPHVTDTEAFIGGFLILFGARFVGGCASGHGLSGLPSLHVVSWFTVPSMFAAAIITGNILASVMGTSAYLLK